MNDELNGNSSQGTLLAIRDRDHLQIKRLHQELRAAIIEGKGMERVIRTSEELIHVTLLHFESEELAMEEKSLATRGLHADLHAGMMETLEDISKDLEKRTICGAMELMKFFDERLSYHLTVEDDD
jgi:hemerythrin-like metal-binding protein